MKRKPKVSVCIPSYNHARYLPMSLESALAQTYRDFEIILVDDGSTDGSLEIAERYAARHPDLIKVYTHPNKVNRGISETGNLAYAKSSGEYWCGLCSDDAWLPDKLAREVEVLNNNPEIGFVYGLAQVIDENGDKVPHGVIGKDISGDADPLASVIRNNPIPALTVMMRRACYEQVGLHEEGLVYSDWELWLRVMAHWKVGFVNEPLALYRVHSYNTSIGIKPEIHLQYSVAAMVALDRKAAEVGGLLATPRIRALLSLQASYFFYYLSEEAQAAQHLRAAFELDPALHSDPIGFARWLEEQTDNSFQPLPENKTKQDFSVWVLANLQPVAGKQFARRATKWQKAQEAARIVLSCHETDLPRARREILECFINEPSRLRDGELRWIFAKTLLGDRAITQIGNFKRRLRSHA